MVIDFSKGCYTGQELVGRLDVRGGNTPWRMVRLYGELESIDAFVQQGPEGPKGVTSSAEHDDAVIALAIVHRGAQNVEGVNATWL